MSSSRNSPAVLRAVLIAALALGLGGCIADTAADSDLPWASNQGWEGMMALPASMTHQYD